MATLSKVPTRAFGKHGPNLSRLGLGLMNNSGVFNLPPPDAERFVLLDHAYNRGETFWDTADEYGNSEYLLGKWFDANPEKRNDIFLSTEFGIRHVNDSLSPNSLID
ncbi:hypothetical protein TSTA_098660 [Talaromyces stipitatus ATCC 10500]|uniref:NADP-dependent oxidoreductase domain-containing protein n=1 Tax=Talaromyces stipitatus (strain ATCC 10500 / CBS 375.48 / QM 6759 / NRRL 1006) TaxID=441959 RepID=B8MMP2_TALSN|nr:uncharacterized protein TSTA_098660 [Talaromyces stipitatus ATCC 10500]EED13609.1 hypothetical protein TSTA_098660 [Talaromyces stipitatus ATCC 10500]